MLLKKKKSSKNQKIHFWAPPKFDEWPQKLISEFLYHTAYYLTYHTTWSTWPIYEVSSKSKQQLRVMLSQTNIGFLIQEASEIILEVIGFSRLLKFRGFVLQVGSEVFVIKEGSEI